MATCGLRVNTAVLHIWGYSNSSVFVEPIATTLALVSAVKSSQARSLSMKLSACGEALCSIHRQCVAHNTELKSLMGSTRNEQAHTVP